jgi:hypothetical protein
MCSAQFNELTHPQSSNFKANTLGSVVIPLYAFKSWQDSQVWSLAYPLAWRVYFNSNKLVDYA